MNDIILSDTSNNHAHTVRQCIERANCNAVVYNPCNLPRESILALMHKGESNWKSDAIELNRTCPSLPIIAFSGVPGSLKKNMDCGFEVADCGLDTLLRYLPKIIDRARTYNPQAGVMSLFRSPLDDALEVLHCLLPCVWAATDDDCSGMMGEATAAWGKLSEWYPEKKSPDHWRISKELFEGFKDAQDRTQCLTDLRDNLLDQIVPALQGSVSP